MCDQYATRDEKFDDSLNDAFPTYEIAGVTICPADILFECDPIAYRVALADFNDAMEEEEEEATDGGVTFYKIEKT